MKIWIDNGHGEDTKGKCSPDGRLREWEYAREIARRVVCELRKRKLDAELLVPEPEDVSLPERCARANAHEADETLLVSIHCNAAGNGSAWMNAKGWSAFVSPNTSDKSRHLAECLTEAAKAESLEIRYQYPGVDYWEQNLYICKNTRCPAVLTENLFQDYKPDVDYLLSERGKQTIVRIHVEGICKYLNNK